MCVYRHNQFLLAIHIELLRTSRMLVRSPAVAMRYTWICIVAHGELRWTIRCPQLLPILVNTKVCAFCTLMPLMSLVLTLKSNVRLFSPILGHFGLLLWSQNSSAGCFEQMADDSQCQGLRLALVCTFRRCGSLRNCR